MIVFISTQLNSEATTSSIKARVLHQIPSLMQSQRIVSPVHELFFTQLQIFANLQMPQILQHLGAFKYCTSSLFHHNFVSDLEGAHTHLLVPLMCLL